MKLKFLQGSCTPSESILGLYQKGNAGCISRPTAEQLQCTTTKMTSEANTEPSWEIQVKRKKELLFFLTKQIRACVQTYLGLTTYPSLLVSRNTNALGNIMAITYLHFHKILWSLGKGAVVARELWKSLLDSQETWNCEFWHVTLVSRAQHTIMLKPVSAGSRYFLRGNHLNT